MEIESGRYAVCKLGKRWFWASWESYDQMCNYGGKSDYAASEAEAEKAALVVVPNGKRWHNHHAAAQHRYLCHQRRLARPPGKSRKATATEFLYCDYYDDDTGETTWRPVPIIRKTAKRVFIQRPFGREETFALDRAKLERDGRVCRRHYYDYYTEEGMEREKREQREREARWQRSRADVAANPLPTDLEILGLSADASQEEIKVAYRRLARQHHPDRGGDRRLFEAVHGAYTRLAWIVEV